MGKRDDILSLMRDGEPRTLKEIEDAVGVGCSSSVTYLFQKGVLLASPVRYFSKAIEYKGGGRWKRPHGRRRWYLLPKEGEEPPFTRRVSFEESDATGRKNIARTERLVFKPFSEQKDMRAKGVVDEKIVEIIETNSTALFASEIAEEAGISRKRVSSILFRLTGRTPPLVKRKGWRRRTDSPRTELMFSRGYLYYTRLDQLKTRLAKRDVLGGQKQILYNRIRRNTEIDRQFTELVGLAKELNVYSKTIADALEEVASVYTNLRKEVIAGSSYYYVDGLLNDEEAEREREFAKARKSGISSYKFTLGRAHEEFCQFAIDRMMEHGDFKVGEECWWTEVVSRDGRRRRRDIYLNCLDASRRYEYDAILKVKTPVGEEPNVLVWEMKYRGDLSKRFYDRLLRKMMDTRDFSTLKLAKRDDGKIVKMRTGLVPLKSNVCPVFVIPTVGKRNIPAGDRMMNFAEYVTSQGGKVVFTQEYERALERYYPRRRVKFQKLFNEWWKTEKRMEFEEFLGKVLS